MFLICSRYRAVRLPGGAALTTAHDGRSPDERKSTDTRCARHRYERQAARLAVCRARCTAFVVRAAELMGFHAIRVAPDNTELHAIAERLPLGKIFATGRAFVPFVSRSAFDKLATLVD